MVSHGVTWCHKVSHGVTWCHKPKIVLQVDYELNEQDTASLAGWCTTNAALNKAELLHFLKRTGHAESPTVKRKGDGGCCCCALL